VQDVEKNPILIWQRISDDSKDLRIANPEQFDKRAYTLLLRDFANAAQRLNSRLHQTLTQLQDDPANVVLVGEGDSRVGYLGLNRWCLTKSRRDLKGVEPAQKLWSFLFDEKEPTHLAELANGKTGMIEVSENAWNEWYEKVSTTDT